MFFSESNSSAEVLISAHLQKVQGHEDKSIPSWTREIRCSCLVMDFSHSSIGHEIDEHWIKTYWVLGHI